MMPATTAPISIAFGIGHGSFVKMRLRRATHRPYYKVSEALSSGRPSA